MISRKEQIAINKYKILSKTLPKELKDYWLKDYTKDERLLNYLNESKSFLSRLQLAVNLRQKHYLDFIKNKREEDPGHRTWRKKMKEVLKDGWLKYNKYLNIYKKSEENKIEREHQKEKQKERQILKLDNVNDQDKNQEDSNKNLERIKLLAKDHLLVCYDEVASVYIGAFFFQDINEEYEYMESIGLVTSRTRLEQLILEITHMPSYYFLLLAFPNSWKVRKNRVDNYNKAFSLTCVYATMVFELRLKTSERKTLMKHLLTHIHEDFRDEIKNHIHKTADKILFKKMNQANTIKNIKKIVLYVSNFDQELCKNQIITEMECFINYASNFNIIYLKHLKLRLFNEMTFQNIESYKGLLISIIIKDTVYPIYMKVIIYKAWIEIFELFPKLDGKDALNDLLTKKENLIVPTYTPLMRILHDLYDEIDAMYKTRFNEYLNKDLKRAFKSSEIALEAYDKACHKACKIL